MAKKQIVGVKGTVVSVTYPTLDKSISVDYSALSAAMQLQAGLHGLKQKLGDAESGGTPTEKYVMVQRIIEGLKADQWELTSTIDMTPLILEAVGRIEKIPQAKLQKVAEKAPEKVKEWGQNLKVKAEIAKIRAEKAAKAAEEADDLNIDL